MRLNLRQIEVFRAIMIAGSISQAAKALNVSQPAVSRLLSYTEQRLGMLLFERIKGRLYPTPEARRLLAEVNLVYQGVQRVNELAEDLIEHRLGHLRVACSPSLGMGFMPMAIAEFLRRFPDARLSLATLAPQSLTQALLTQQADLGVVFLPQAHPNLAARPLYGNRLVAALPRSHALARRKVLSLEALAAQPFIGYSPEVPIGQVVRQLFSEAGLSLRPKVEVQQVHVACALVQAGVGVSIIDEFAAGGPTGAGLAVRPIKQAVDAPVHVVHPAFEPMSRLAHAFVETLEDLKVGLQAVAPATQAYQDVMDGAQKVN